MSRGHGTIERFILATLTRRGRLTAQAIAAAYPAHNDILPSRSFMSSLNRALGKLERSKMIERVGKRGPSGWKLADASEDREATAFHEAAHAVIAHSLSMPVRNISIKPTGNTAGHVLHSGDPKKHRLSKHAMRDEVLVCFAGAIGQRKWAKSKSRPLRAYSRPASDGAESDNKRISELIGWIIGHPFQPSIFEDYHEERAALKARATRLVEKQWPTIERVANYLIDEEKLTGDGLDYVMSKRS